MSRSRSKHFSPSEEGSDEEVATDGVTACVTAVTACGVTLGCDAMEELVSKLGDEAEVEEEVDTVMVVLVTTFGAAKGKEVAPVVIAAEEEVAAVVMEEEEVFA